MSWHTSGIILRGDWHRSPAKLFGELGFAEPKWARSASFEEVTGVTLEGRAVGYVKGWTIVWDAHMFFNLAEPEAPSPDCLWSAPVDWGLTRLSQDSFVFSFILEGSSGTYGYSVYQGGHRIRTFLAQEDTVRIDSGDALQEETAVFARETDGEARIFLLMERLAVSARDLEPMHFDVYCFPDSMQSN